MKSWKRVVPAILMSLVMWSVVPALHAEEVGEKIPALTEELRLYVGDVHVIEGAGISEVMVGSSEVVNASALGAKGLLISAKGPGETTIRVWRGGVQKIYYVHVFPENMQRVYREIKVLITGVPGARLLWLGNNLVVEGEGVSSHDRQRLGRLLAAYPSVVNMLQEQSRERATMIYMDVRIIEFSRSGITSLGVDWADDMAGPVWVAAGDVHKSTGFQSGVLKDVTGLPATTRVSPFQTYFGIATRLDSRINLLEQSGEALMVAHPILSCRNEGKASFLSGGQVPFASASATGTPSVEFKDYGIKLEIEPVLGDDQTVFARIAAEVSDLDKSTTVNTVPGLLTRRTETEFSMKVGETIVLSGLVNKTTGTDENSVPGLGRIPLLGKFFSSKSKSSRRSELVIFVTPMVQDAIRPALATMVGESEKVLQRETADANMLHPWPTQLPTPSSENKGEGDQP